MNTRSQTGSLPKQQTALLTVQSEEPKIPAQLIPDTPLKNMVVAETTQTFVTPPTLHLANGVHHPKTGKLMSYRQLIRDPDMKEKWSASSAREFFCLAQGSKKYNIEGSDTIFFIPKQKVPKDRTVTYGKFVCDLKPHKKELERTRLTVGGNKIEYPDDVSAPTSDITQVKCMANAIISDPKAKALILDIHNFYLNTPME